MKIFINELQIYILQKLLTEAKYQDVVKTVKPNDNLKIVDKNKAELNFGIIFNDNGQLYLKSTNKGSIYSNDLFFLDMGSLSDDSLTIKRINIPAELRSEKNDSKKLKEILKSTPVTDWKNITFKSINELFIDDEEIDLDKTSSQKNKEIDKYKPVVDPSEISDLLSDFNSFKEGSNYNFTLMDGGLIKTNLFNNKGGSLNFKVLKDGLINSAKNYKNLVDADIRLDVNANNIKKFEYYNKDTDESSTYYDITFKSVLGGMGKGSEKTVIVKYITDINLVTEEKKSKKEKKLKKPDIDKMSTEDITDLVLNDPTFKAAFYKQPGFLSSLLGGKPSGILQAKKILGKYFNSIYGDSSNSKSIKNLNEKFKASQEYIIQLTDGSFNRGDVELDINSTYGDGTEKIKAYKETDTFGNQIPFLKGNGYKIKINKQINNSNQYRVTIITNDDYSENRTMKIINAY